MLKVEIKKKKPNKLTNIKPNMKKIEKKIMNSCQLGLTC